ncbi:hypothetical protein [Burkholderia ambifaria]|jgi:streptomycin 3"-adenylyltransferase|uniref:Streptomycin 3''-adenylyltransferase n=1 Tax=Burkholderia ambifaria (strain ATCC BAA-244 / DSM 16087 / CCUG 44356 / LMG 19182 / AMMD) TaxID=339670 RepID=Q0BA97_BURCM|nr:hypothetical protein [Burkholderia ambifaria]ABI88926.1 streptomycin 3''-adenylyltransferase [Burkholderia ambifaria AMMD]UZU02536.1 hypothetical protein OR987_05980 [Burkholderia ambifaria]UZU09088.1 hypothetical protein OR988_05980 [Burkholderia ambifaria]WDS12666.1 hypothetical protein OR984_16260 [Burkholderia ambifaria]WDS25800.1 hypothetical protein OR983_16285 [Burkholderia ambifaria]
MVDLLDVSALPGSTAHMRPLEATIVVRGDVVSWRHPARRALQLDEWLRRDLRAGIVESPSVGRDLAILLTKIRKHDVALLGSRAAAWFEPVPAHDFVAASCPPSCSGMPNGTGAATNTASCLRTHASSKAP